MLTLHPPGQRERDDAGPSGSNPYRVADGPADPAARPAGHGWSGNPVRPGTIARAYGRTPAPEDADHLPPRRHLLNARRTEV